MAISMYLKFKKKISINRPGLQYLRYNGGPVARLDERYQNLYHRNSRKTQHVL